MANFWYEKWIYFNYSMCFNNLGSLYLNGQGVEQDYKRAFELFEKAAELESDYGMSSLAFLYENGYGVNMDINKAIDLYKEAAELGNQYAIDALKRLNV